MSFRRFVILAILSCLAAPAAFASADSFGDEVISDPVVKTIYTLFNAGHSNACIQPAPTDVRTFCMGALPEVTKPTIVRNGCGFLLQIHCVDGALLTINGESMGYVIVDQNQQVSDPTAVGIVVQGVQITPPSH